MAEATQSRAEMAAQLGLGCFHLVPRAEAEHATPISLLLPRIAAALAGVPGVSEVATVFTPAVEGADPAFSGIAPWFAQGRSAASVADDLEISFRLAMSRDLLGKLGPLYRGLGRWPRDIQVAISYERLVPVVAAWSMEGAGEATGTTAIDILRRHLERCLAGSAFALDVLEPSPFPADIRVVERPLDAKPDQLLAVSLLVQPGFDVIDVSVDTQDASFEDMIGHVRYQAQMEADDYYSVMIGMAETERLWDAAVDRFNAFVSGERGRTGWLRGSSDKIRDLMLDFIETKAAVLAAWHDMAGRVEKARNSDAGLLSAHIVQRYERLPSFPFDEYMRMLDFLEGRRTHRSDAQIAIISAVIGGLIGSLYVLFY